ncbi:MAG: hypothetical protein ACRDMJ_07535 [Solirubrobacteraceae bacterium]
MDVRATDRPAGRIAASLGRTSHRRSSPPRRALRFCLSAALALGILAFGAATASAQPVAAGTPTIAGAAVVGGQLTVTPAQWSDGAGPVAVSDEWDACDPSGGDCHTIGRGDAYTVAPGDAGEAIEVAEAADAPDGTTYADSAPTAPASFPPPVADATHPAGVSGTAQAGQTLVESHALWTPAPTSFAYQWLNCDAAGAACTPIPGATDATYLIPEAEVGARLRLEETASYQSSQGATSESAMTPIVQGDSWVQLAVSSAVATVGDPLTLTATVTSDAAGVSPAGTVTFDEAGVPIPGCTGTPLPAATGQSASVTCTASLAAPQALLSATFAPSTGSLIAGSISPTATLPVTRATPSVVLVAARRTQAATRTRYTTMIVPPPGAPAPSAAVTFDDGGRPIAGCADRPLHGAVSTCSVTWPVPGTHRLTARYLGDAQLAPAGSAVVSQTITPAPIRGRVAATLSWVFYFAPGYTRVLGLTLAGAPRGGTVELDCHGGGCPFAVRRRRVSGPDVDLARGLAGRRLAIGARLTVVIDHSGYVGKYYGFTVRARASPAVRIACLAPGSPLPGVACTLASSRSGLGPKPVVPRARAVVRTSTRSTGGAVIARLAPGRSPRGLYRGAG